MEVKRQRLLASMSLSTAQSVKLEERRKKNERISG